MELYHPQLEVLADELYEFSASVFYKRGPTQGRGLLIHGDTGSGKTSSVSSFAKWFMMSRMAIGPVVQRNQEGEEETSIADLCQVHWPQVVDGFKQEQWLICEDLCNLYFAIIDDIGAEHDPSRIGEEKLYLILSRREFKHTIVTTNIRPEAFTSRFDRRIASRLFRNFTHIDLGQVPDFSTR